MSFSPIAVPLAKAYILLNHGPTTLVTSAHGERRNVMAASWAMPLDFEPPKVAVVIDSRTLTRELIEASGEFVLNLPSRAIARQTLQAGSISGRDQDKFAALGLCTAPAQSVAAPLLVDCLAWLECKLIVEPHHQKRYDVFIGEVVAAWADPHVFVDGRWKFPDELRRTIHYQAGGDFFATGEHFEA